jgi:hypothetical protein
MSKVAWAPTRVLGQALFDTEMSVWTIDQLVWSWVATCQQDLPLWRRTMKSWWVVEDMFTGGVDDAQGCIYTVET